MRKENVIRAIARHGDEIKSFGVSRMHLFGSAARNEAGPASDIDMFIDLKRGAKFSLFDLMDLRDLLVRLLRRKVDVFARDGLHPMIRAQAVREAIRVL